MGDDPATSETSEADQRRGAAIGGLAAVATLALVMWELVTDGTSAVLLVAAVPLFVAAESYFQARYRINTPFATLGLQEAGAENEARDERLNAHSSWRPHVYAATVAVVGLALLYVVSLLVSAN
jgi:hypothetical protein